MKMLMKKFGDILISRPAGREAFLAASAYSLPKGWETMDLELDFENVPVVAPSWLDEFLSGLCSKNKGTIVIKSHGNQSLIESCHVIEWPIQLVE